MAFAKDFVCGAASSAYQTEGSPRADGGGESIWDVFCRRPGAVADGFDGSGLPYFGGFVSNLPGEHSIKTVSYTHLDVYKRQGN